MLFAIVLPIYFVAIAFSFFVCVVCSSAWHRLQHTLIQLNDKMSGLATDDDDDDDKIYLSMVLGSFPYFTIVAVVAVQGIYLCHPFKCSIAIQLSISIKFPNDLTRAQIQSFFQTVFSIAHISLNKRKYQITNTIVNCNLRKLLLTSFYFFIFFFFILG